VGTSDGSAVTVREENCSLFSVTVGLVLSMAGILD